MWACLGSTCLGPSVFPISCYQYPLDLENFQPGFLQMYFQSAFLFLLPLESVLCINLPALYYPIGLIFLSFFSIWFSVCCPDWVISIILCSTSLILSSALFIQVFIAFPSVCISANEFSSFLGSSLYVLIPF